MKFEGSSNTQSGFIQIPMLVAAIIAIGAVITGGSYYAIQDKQETENSKSESSIQTILNKLKVVEETKNNEIPELIIPAENNTGAILDLEKYRIIEKPKVESEELKKYLISIKEIIDNLYESDIEVRKKIINTETEISDFRIEKLRNLANLSSIEVITKTYEELIAIEELRKKKISLILSDSLTNAHLYSIEIKKVIESLENDDFSKELSSAQKLINAYPERFDSLKEQSEIDIESAIAENKAYAQEFLLRMESTGAIADRLVLSLKALEEIKEIQKEIKEISTSISYETYLVPINMPSIQSQIDTGNLTCKYPVSKFILIPGKGWVAVKQCDDGRYIEADKYSPDTSSMTPQQICDMRKSAWLSQGAKINQPSCNDLGL
ncbi:MAG: hypothetical protein WC349_05305 [Patescibacteria group bacterium]|jgi:hypothetical protein